ncbi:Transcriptional regulator LacI/GalR-like sensor domain-containing protein [Salmonella enterica subsp. arizonae]|uniref:Regulatory protein n=1 Tax=Salmonella enterica subsp. arizonae TaxID=59203 RepID=A0A379S8J6_SALER|nr:regulatory protein [Salmonella enterica subsp. arizonae]SUG49836.1 regulatory protein [Salmonella enterica subsp. arizonae]
MCWTVAAVLRIALGSATVAAVTTAGVVLPIINVTHADPALVVLATGAGSVIASHVNDPGFWLFNLGSKDDIRDEQRYHSYCDAMTRRGLAPLRINPRAISSIHLGIQLMRDALAAHPDVDGVFCTNDDIAMGALLWCRERQLAVPEQISIAGFHGLEMGRQMIPSLASVIPPAFRSGTAQMLLNKIKNNDLNHNTIDLGYQIYHGNTL